MKTIIPALALVMNTFNCASQENILQSEKKIIRYLEQRDSASLARMVDDQFILVHADGLVQNKSDFITAYAGYSPSANLALTTKVDKIIEKGDITILHGVLIQQWQEGSNTLRLKIPYTDSYRRSGKEWILLTSFVNDNGEEYFRIKDTTGIKDSIQARYKILDESVEKKDLCLHLGLKTGDFTTYDHLGNIGSPKFMRLRSKLLFNAIIDSVESTNTVEAISFADDTAKVIVHQAFYRRQMAGGKIRYMQTTVRQRESWMQTREGWKLVFVDQVQPLTRIVNGIPTDASKPVNWNDPVFKKG
jgi:hypothetical protein